MTGTVTWLGKYRAGNNDTDRFVSVDHDDVQRLQQTGQFVIADMPGPLEPATLPLEPEQPEDVVFTDSAVESEAKAEIMSDQPRGRRRK